VETYRGFCMRFVRGFDEQIIEELDNKNPEFHSEAALARGSWALKPRGHTSLPLSIRTEPQASASGGNWSSRQHSSREASKVLSRLSESDNEGLVEAVHEALAMAEEPSDEDDIFLQ